MSRPAYPAVLPSFGRQWEEQPPLVASQRDQIPRLATIDVHGLPTFLQRPLPMPQPPAGSPAIAQRRIRVALLVEEEGLERGARTRIAGWLGVSLSTIGRDVRALLAAGDPIVTNAIVRAERHRLGTAG